MLHLPDVTHSCDMGLGLHAISQHRMHVCTFKKLAGNLLYSSLVINPIRFLSLAALATKSALSPAKNVHFEQGLPTASSRTCDSLGCRLAHAVDVHSSRRPTETIGSYTRQAPRSAGISIDKVKQTWQTHIYLWHKIEKQEVLSLDFTKRNLKTCGQSNTERPNIWNV